MIIPITKYELNGILGFVFGLKIHLLFQFFPECKEGTKVILLLLI